MRIIVSADKDLILVHFPIYEELYFASLFSFLYSSAVYRMPYWIIINPHFRDDDQTCDSILTVLGCHCSYGEKRHHI